MVMAATVAIVGTTLVGSVGYWWWGSASFGSPDPVAPVPFLILAAVIAVAARKRHELAVARIGLAVAGVGLVLVGSLPFVSEATMALAPVTIEGGVASPLAPILRPIAEAPIISTIVGSLALAAITAAAGALLLVGLWRERPSAEALTNR